MNEIELKKIKYKDYNNAWVGSRHDEKACNEGNCICYDGCICPIPCISDMEEVKRKVIIRNEMHEIYMNRVKNEEYNAPELEKIDEIDKFESDSSDSDNKFESDDYSYSHAKSVNQRIDAYIKINPSRKINKCISRRIYNNCDCNNDDCEECMIHTITTCNYKDCDKDVITSGDCYGDCCSYEDYPCNFFCDEHKCTHFAVLFTISLNKHRFAVAANEIKKRYWVLNMNSYDKKRMKFAGFYVIETLNNISDINDKYPNGALVYDMEKNEFVGECNL